MSTNPPGSKIGYSGPPDRTRPTILKPGVEQGQAETQTFIDTYFTRVSSPSDGPQVIYNGDRQWARVTLTLETAGPVAIGTVQDLSPVSSGKGELLTTDEPTRYTIAKGNRLYILATGVNRIKRKIEPVPWLEQITGTIGAILNGVRQWLAAKR